jgi:hypothetical protein
LKFQEEILSNSKPRKFYKFSFKTHSESGEVPIERVVLLFKTFTTTVYLKNLRPGRSFLDRLKFA